MKGSEAATQSEERGCTNLVKVCVDEPGLCTVGGNRELQVWLLQHQTRQLLDRVLRGALRRLQRILHVLMRTVMSITAMTMAAGCLASVLPAYLAPSRIAQHYAWWTLAVF